MAALLPMNGVRRLPSTYCAKGDPMRLTASRPQLLTVAQAATLLNVSDRTIRRWIEREQIPFLELPGGGYRIPQGALLSSLRGNYDLSAELRELDAKHTGATDEQISNAASEPR